MSTKSSRRILVAALICALIIPILDIAILGSLTTVFASDVSYPLILSELLGYLNELIAVGCVFATVGFIAVAQLRKRSSVLVMAIALISPVLLYTAAVLVDRAFWGDDVLGAINLLTLTVNGLFEMVRAIVVAVVCKRIARIPEPDVTIYAPTLFELDTKPSKAAVWSTVTVFASLLLSAIIETVSLLLQYGAPVNSRELISLIVPYLTAVIYSLLGYFAVYFVIKKFNVKGN